MSWEESLDGTCDRLASVKSDLQDALRILLTRFNAQEFEIEDVYDRRGKRFRNLTHAVEVEGDAHVYSKNHGPWCQENVYLFICTVHDVLTRPRRVALLVNRANDITGQRRK